MRRRRLKALDELVAWKGKDHPHEENQPANISLGGTTGPIVAADFQGSGKLDLAIAGQGGISLLNGSSNGAFSAPANAVSLTGGLVAMAAGDFNRSGRIGLAVVDNASSSVKVLAGNGNGTFGSPVSLSTGIAPTDLIAVDVNGDSRLDLVATYGAGRSPSGFSVLLQGSSGFQPAVNVSAGSALKRVATADFNRDGRPDLAMVNASPLPPNSPLAPANVLIFLGKRRRNVSGGSLPASRF